MDAFKELRYLNKKNGLTWSDQLEDCKEEIRGLYSARNSFSIKELEQRFGQIASACEWVFNHEGLNDEEREFFTRMTDDALRLAEWFFSNNSKEITEPIEAHLAYEDLKTQKEQIRLLFDLGVIHFLADKYPARLKDNNNQMAELLGKILKLERSSIQPTINALLKDDASNKNYPMQSARTQVILSHLNEG